MSKIVEGFKLLADLQYHLSRARRAFIVPSLNFLGKTVSDAAPIDDRLFGNNFAEDVNSAQSVERVAKKMARKPPPTLGPSTEICDSSPEEGLPPTESYQENTIPFEVTVNPLTDSAGRLSQFADQWRLITSDPQEPALSTLETEAYDMEIQRLCTKGALAIVNPSKDQFLSSFFLISKSSGGMRFILNLKDLNSYITPSHFKMEDWRTVIRLMTLNCKMATIDLENAYLDFASLIGSLVSVCPAAPYGLLYTKRFEREKFLALDAESENYEAWMLLPDHLREDFDWWSRTLANPYLASIIHSGSYALEIYSDASLTGWGASCGAQRTHGWWSPEDKSLHINVLELKGSFFALQCFAAHCHDCYILLRIDNTTAISYINRFGSVQHLILSDIARDIWKWCEARNIFLFASYIASIDNVIADAESRVLDTDTEWSLSSQAFHIVDNVFGPFDIDLFASSINAKLDLYVSWLPDPGSWAIDAFTLPWNHFYFYAFPPFILISRVLRKIIEDKAEGVLIVPWWPSQPWFPIFSRLLVSDPVTLQPSYSLLSSPFRNKHPEWRSLSLAAGKLSGRPSNYKKFRPTH
ncbi:uncharacterized protein [Cardiocondyla obscurior]|uniref:uncharacterized protein n=1 Tax=Cardiocondyla obscurior TaxID=286306 RepID=UPI0039657242